jgi:cbb3-type cytochrome oxidase maturation protein
MTIILLLAPLALLLAALSLWGFWWTVANGQYDDPKGDAERILNEENSP